MRYIAIFIFCAVALQVRAANLTCTVPNAVIPRARELCELVRQRLLVRTADWSDEACLNQILRLGLLEAERTATREEVQNATSTAVADALKAMRQDWPITITRAYCGDGIVDVMGSYVETCDPPDGGVTCDDACQTITP